MGVPSKRPLLTESDDDEDNNNRHDISGAAGRTKNTSTGQPSFVKPERQLTMDSEALMNVLDDNDDDDDVGDDGNDGNDGVTTTKQSLVKPQRQPTLNVHENNEVPPSQQQDRRKVAQPSLIKPERQPTLIKASEEHSSDPANSLPPSQQGRNNAVPSLVKPERQPTLINVHDSHNCNNGFPPYSTGNDGFVNAPDSDDGGGGPQRQSKLNVHENNVPPSQDCRKVGQPSLVKPERQPTLIETSHEHSSDPTNLLPLSQQGRQNAVPSIVKPERKPTLIDATDVTTDGPDFDNGLPASNGNKLSLVVPQRQLTLEPDDGGNMMESITLSAVFRRAIKDENEAKLKKVEEGDEDKPTKKPKSTKKKKKKTNKDGASSSTLTDSPAKKKKKKKKKKKNADGTSSGTLTESPTKPKKAKKKKNTKDGTSSSTLTGQENNGEVVNVESPSPTHTKKKRKKKKTIGDDPKPTSMSTTATDEVTNSNDFSKRSEQRTSLDILMETTDTVETKPPSISMKSRLLKNVMGFGKLRKKVKK
jgi:hypothetical protein